MIRTDRKHTGASVGFIVVHLNDFEAGQYMEILNG
jgi:hypothetical protein